MDSDRVEKSNLSVTDEEVGKLVQDCKYLWKAANISPLTAHTLCDMVHYLVYDGKGLDCEAVETSDIPYLMCDRYICIWIEEPTGPSENGPVALSL